MLKAKITRRDFLKGSVALAGAATALSFLQLTSKKLNATEVYTPGWNIEWRPNMCAFCANVCGEVVRVHKKGNLARPLKLEGNENDNYNQGKLCARGQSGLKYLYNPDRITTPLIRIPGSKRGEWKFKKATWQEAYAYIMQKMMGVNYPALEMRGLGWVYTLFGVPYHPGGFTPPLLLPIPPYRGIAELLLAYIPASLHTRL